MVRVGLRTLVFKTPAHTNLPKSVKSPCLTPGKPKTLYKPVQNLLTPRMIETVTIYTSRVGCVKKTYDLGENDDLSVLSL